MAAPLRRSLAEQLRAQADFSWRTRHLAALRKVMHRALESGARQHIAGFAQPSSDGSGRRHRHP
ncbi:MAG: hypothetical protein U1F35_18160 [Steroidobacteraceae bacterium]